ncbi:unnamed protein product [Lactuca saligna]|uniref:Uncharacterized protein n=1 Tax=Lactuca saligna TaxID=75948 RepID=A0AA35YVP1_LACSI|nr:unnamed protein product [Lactuca saligna]
MLSQIETIPDIKALKKDVVKLFENLYKYDDGANFFDDQHQGPVSATLSVILGDRILGLATFFLGIGIPGNSKDLYHQIDALDCLDQNRKTCAGAIMLTDLLFWCLLLPFQSGDGFKLTLLIGCMHSLNAVFLILDSAINNLVSDWIAFTNWYFGIAFVHLPCYGLYVWLVKVKASMLSKMFLQAFIVQRVVFVYNLPRRKITQLDDAKRVILGISRRANLWLGTVLMNKGARVNTKRRVGPVPGVDIGNVFFF